MTKTKAQVSWPPVVGQRVMDCYGCRIVTKHILGGVFQVRFPKGHKDRQYKDYRQVKDLRPVTPPKDF